MSASLSNYLDSSIIWAAGCFALVTVSFNLWLCLWDIPSFLLSTQRAPPLSAASRLAELFVMPLGLKLLLYGRLNYGCVPRFLLWGKHLV